MIDVATVVFNEELEFLKTQAKSIHLYSEQDLIDNIFIVVNDTKDVCDQINLDWYRSLRSKVKIVHYKELTSETESLTGWDSQQLLKLLISAKSNNDYCYVLDAKTWFVNSFTGDTFFSSSNRAYGVLMPMFENFSKSANFLTSYFKHPMNHIIGPGGVPFAFHSSTVKSLIKYIEDKEFIAFDQWFKQKVVYPFHVTEFTLYSGYVLVNNLFSKLYSGQQKYEVHNVADFQITEFNTILKQMCSPRTLTTSIHRNVYRLLSDQQYQAWCKFLYDKKLYVSPEIAKMQLNTFRPGVYNDTGVRL